jgi:ABC-2 type transport system permease protein
MKEVRRVLGAMPTLFRVGFAGAIAYPSQLLIGLLAENMSLVMLAFWSAVAAEGPIGGFDQEKFGAYFLTSAIVRMLTTTWLVYDMNAEIRQGTLAKRLLRPIHPFLSYATEALASLPLRLLVSVPLSLVTLYLVAGGHVVGERHLILAAPLAILGACLLALAVNLTIGALCLFWDNSLAVWDLWLGLALVFSGYLLPLELLPGWLRQLAHGSPFPYLLAFPVEALLGLSPPEQVLADLGIQWLYVAAFLAGALLLWRRGLMRFVAYGG